MNKKIEDLLEKCRDITQVLGEHNEYEALKKNLVIEIFIANLADTFIEKGEQE